MAELIAITEGLVKTTTGTESQSLQNAVDVLRFDSLDLLVTAAFESPSSPYLDLYLLSGNQCRSTDGWVAVSLSPPVRGTPPLANACWTITGGFFRYVRWQVHSLTGATAARFRIDGSARRNGRS